MPMSVGTVTGSPLTETLSRGWMCRAVPSMFEKGTSIASSRAGAAGTRCRSRFLRLAFPISSACRAAALAAPAGAALLDRDAGDHERGGRVEPPEPEERVPEQADEDCGGQM